MNDPKIWLFIIFVGSGGIYFALYLIEKYKEFKKERTDSISKFRREHDDVIVKLDKKIEQVDEERREVMVCVNNYYNATLAEIERIEDKLSGKKNK